MHIVTIRACHSRYSARAQVEVTETSPRHLYNSLLTEPVRRTVTLSMWRTLQQLCALGTTGRYAALGVEQEVTREAGRHEHTCQIARQFFSCRWTFEQAVYCQLQPVDRHNAHMTYERLTALFGKDADIYTT